MDNLQEICVGDWIQFHESLEYEGYNKQGNRVLFNRDRRQVVRGQVVGKTATGKLKLAPCFTHKDNGWVKQEKTTRKPDKLEHSTRCTNS